MILIGADVTRHQLLSKTISKSFLDCCDIYKPSQQESTLAIKLKTTALGSKYEKVFLQRNLYKINQHQEVKEKTLYFRDIDELRSLLEMYIKGEEPNKLKKLSDDALAGRVSSYEIDSEDGTITVDEFIINNDFEPEPDEEGDFHLVDIPSIKLPDPIQVEEVEDIPILPFEADLIDTYETKEYIEKAKTEIELKEVNIKKLELANQEAKALQEKEVIKKSVKKKKPSLLKGFFVIILTLFDWVAEVIKWLVTSVIITISVYVVYCLLSGKPVDLQVGVSLYESLKALGAKVVSDIQSVKQ